MCIVAAGLTLFAVGALFHFVVPMVAPDIPAQFQNNPALYRPWAGWTSTYMYLHPFGYGAVFAVVYLMLIARGVAVRGWRGGLVYGFGVFVVGSLPVYLLAYASFQMSPEMIVSWVAQSACQYTAAGAVVGWIAGHAQRRAAPDRAIRG